MLKGFFQEVVSFGHKSAVLQGLLIFFKSQPKCIQFGFVFNGKCYLYLKIENLKFQVRNFN